MVFGSRQQTNRLYLRRALLAAIVGLAFLSVSCSARQPTSTAEGETTAPTGDAPEAATPTAEPEPRPDDEPGEVPEELQFRAPLLAGGMVRGAEYAGRDVAVWFWAPW